MTPHPTPTLDILPGCWPHVLTFVKVSKNTQMNFPYPFHNIFEKKCCKKINHFLRRDDGGDPFFENPRK